MIIVALFIGVILVIAGVRNSQSALFSALATDVPAFVVWAAAIAGVGAIGFIPGLKTPSRLLLGLVLIVLFVNNYKSIVSGLQSASSAGAGVSNTSSTSGSQTSGSASNSSSTSFNIAQLSSVASNVASVASAFGG